MMRRFLVLECVCLCVVGRTATGRYRKVRWMGGCASMCDTKARTHTHTQTHTHTWTHTRTHTHTHTHTHTTRTHVRKYFVGMVTCISDVNILCLMCAVHRVQKRLMYCTTNILYYCELMDIHIVLRFDAKSACLMGRFR